MSRNKGNVVLGFTSDNYLMLDCDSQIEPDVIWFAKAYAKEYGLGSALVMKSSEGNYFIIFGKRVSWEEVKWHVGEAYRLGMVNEEFADVRQFGTVTIRVNAKNKEKPHPTIVAYFDNGDDTGIWEFIDRWVMCRRMGA